MRYISVPVKFFCIYFLLFSLGFSFFSLIAYAQEIKNISVSAVVPPNQSDYQFAFTPDGQTNVPQNTTLNYAITYGAQTSGGVTTTTTIVANFSDDQAPGGSDVLDYVIGSASTGYGGSVPVIDLTNRTITWTIPNLPAGTINQNLTFQLRTNENYTGPDVVNFTTKASMSNEYVTMPDQTITQAYQFDSALVTPTPTPTSPPTPTPTPGIPPTGLPGPTTTRTPQPTATPAAPTITPTPTQSGLQITDIAFNKLLDSMATIAITTNRIAKEQIRFGTSPTALTQSVQTDQFQTVNTLDLTNLSPATKYYFQITATDQSGHFIKSEIFTFTTAGKSQPTIPSNNAVVITSGGTVIASGVITPTSPVPFGILTTNTDYQLTYSFDNDPNLQSVEVIIRNADGTQKIVHMTAKDARTFIANLRTAGPGTFDVVVRMTDQNGNVTEQKVAQLKVLTRLTVLEKDTSLPIGDARIFLSVFNPKTKAFEPLSEASFGWLKNPSFTNKLGELEATLPSGRYRVQISAFGYDGKTVDFTLGPKPGEDFPTVYLQKDIFNISALLYFIRDWFIDLLNGLRDAFFSLASSVRFYNSIAALALFSSVALGFLLFRIRTGIKLQYLAPFVLFHFFALINKHNEKYLHGIVLTSDETPINQARIEVLDLKTGTVLTHVVTNSNGRFAIKNTFRQPFIKFIVSKEGVSELEVMVATNTRKEIRIVMEHTKEQTPALISGFEQLAGRFFETILVIALLAELFFLPTFGWAKTLPFIALSLLNLLLWIFYLKEKKANF